MVICPNNSCRHENLDGSKFCEECGTPLPLPMKKCPKCSTEITAKAKFCFNCGCNVQDGAIPDAPSVSIGDKNVIAGDLNVVGHQDVYNLSGNATIIKNEDESKRIITCSICGANVVKSESYRCPSCGEMVCNNCFDRNKKICKKCSHIDNINKEKEYLDLFSKTIEDGRIDIDEREKLEQLRKKLGLSTEKASELEKQNSKKTAEKLSVIEEKQVLEAERLFYGENKPQDAMRIIEPLYKKYPHLPEILKIYYPLLAEINADGAQKQIDSLSADIVYAYLSKIDILIESGKLSEAEHVVNRAKALWPEEPLVDCRKVLFLCAFGLQEEDESYIDSCLDIIDTIKLDETVFSKSWIAKLKASVERYCGTTERSITSKHCIENGLYRFLVLPKERIVGKEKWCDYWSLQKAIQEAREGWTLALLGIAEEKNLVIDKSITIIGYENWEVDKKVEEASIIKCINMSINASCVICDVLITNLGIKEIHSDRIKDCISIMNHLMCENDGIYKKQVDFIQIKANGAFSHVVFMGYSGDFLLARNVMPQFVNGCLFCQDFSGLLVSTNRSRPVLIDCYAVTENWETKKNVISSIITVGGTNCESDYHSLKEAVDNEETKDTDIICVFAGEYKEERITINKNLTIIGPSITEESASKMLAQFVFEKDDSLEINGKCVFGDIVFLQGEYGLSFDNYGYFLDHFYVSYYENENGNPDEALVNCHSSTVFINSIITCSEKNGLVIDDSDIYVQHCYFIGNEWDNCVLKGNSHTEIRESFFIASKSGSGLTAMDNAKIEVFGCRFIKNSEGGIVLAENSECELSSSDANENQLDGLIVFGSATVKNLHYCNFNSNKQFGIRIAEDAKLELRESSYSVEGNDCGVAIAVNGQCNLGSLDVNNNGIGIQIVENSSCSITRCGMSSNKEVAFALNGNASLIAENVWEEKSKDGAIIEEKSSATFRRSYFSGNTQRGIIVADNSQLKLFDCSFDDNEDGIHAFGSATAKLVSCSIRDNENSAISAEADSRVFVSKNCNIDGDTLVEKDDNIVFED